MEKGCVGEDAMECGPGQVEVQEPLLQHFATRMLTRHGAEIGARVQTYGFMAHLLEGDQIPSWPTAQIQDFERTCAAHMPEKGFSVLAHVVVPRPFPKPLGGPVVIIHRNTLYFFKFSLGCHHHAP